MHGLVWVVEINESLKSIKERIEKRGGVALRPFQVDYLNYRPKPSKYSTTRALGLLHHSQFPLSTFTISVPSSTGKQAKCVSDRGFDLIIPKLKAALEPDHFGYFEGVGMEYQVDEDFRVRVASITMGKTTVKGTTLEVEYLPSAHANGVPALIEFTNAIINDGNKRSPVHFKTTDGQYNPLETLQQYKDIFTEMRNRP